MSSTALPTITTPLPPRFLVKVLTDAATGCWNWIGALRTKEYKNTVYAYGTFSRDGRPDHIVLAHRFSYEKYVGPVPDGLEIDHVCQNKLCVNPEHLEAVTHQVNCQRRSKSGPYRTAREASVMSATANPW